MRDAPVLTHACKSYEEDLVLYYYGESGEADRLHIEQHLGLCSSCQSFLDDLRRLLPQMAQTETRPQAFWDNYYRETIAKLAEQQERKHWWRDLLSPVKMWAVPAFGTVAIAILAIGLVIGKGKLGFVTDNAPANIPQEILVDADQLEFFKSLDMLESLSALEDQEGKSSERKSNQSSFRQMDKEIV